MRTAPTDILSDTTNAAVLRHPDRHFPGILVQGDTLYTLCQRADQVCREIGRASSGFGEANELRNVLHGLLSHYKGVLGEHGIPLPFSEQPL